MGGEQPCAPPDARSSGDAETMFNGARYTVLILADGPAGEGLNAGFLRQANIRLVRHEGAAGAADAIRRAKPDLIIQDLTPEDDQRLAAALQGDRCASIPSIRFFVEGNEVAGRPGEVLRIPIVLREYFETVSKFITLPKRRALRHEVNLRFVYRVADGTHHAFSRDLSAYGAFLKTDHTWPAGTRLDLSFKIPGHGGEIRCRGLVRAAAPVRAGGYRTQGFGVEFEGLDAADQERLQSFIERNTPRGVFSRALS
jgi:uncharacterized protein (TIGR02266 family)